MDKKRKEGIEDLWQYGFMQDGRCKGCLGSRDKMGKIFLTEGRQDKKFFG